MADPKGVKVNGCSGDLALRQLRQRDRSNRRREDTARLDASREGMRLDPKKGLFLQENAARRKAGRRVGQRVTCRNELGDGAARQGR